MGFKLSKKKVLVVGLAVFFVPFFIQATELEFNVDPAYDYSGRTKISAFLHQLGVNAYFYVEDEYYQNLDIDDKKVFANNLRELAEEFDDTIYPKMTSLFGSEWKPGVDEDNKITVLLTRIKNENGGYFNSGDEYPQAQVAGSNELEMVYLNVNYINTPLAKGFLAHEFFHLISFNQKERVYGVTDEVWLAEAMADSAVTFLGYDDEYEGSNLQRRVKSFAQKPDDSLTEWNNSSVDYGTANIFIQYLIDHYNIKVLADALRSEETGIASLNKALKKNGFSEDFAKVFRDWLVTVFVNDCNLGAKYCFSNQNLKSLKILPQLNYLPSTGESVLTVTDYSKDWAGNWFKFIGGKGTLKLEFIGDARAAFQVPYVTRDILGNYALKFFDLADLKSGTIYVPDFGIKYDSLTIIPFTSKKTSGFSGLEPYYQFIWSASIIDGNQEKENEALIIELLARIDALKKQIAALQAQIAAIQGKELACSGFNRDLYYGLTNDKEVSCLQQFLKIQGQGIYPQGLITGNYLSMTREAVILFQERHSSDVLEPIGLERGTGFFGSLSRKKANELLKK